MRCAMRESPVMVFIVCYGHIFVLRPILKYTACIVKKTLGIHFSHMYHIFLIE